jgi:hypothetical protein
MINRRQAIKTTALAGIALTARTAAHSAVLARAAADSRPANLAAQILADQNLRDVLRMAQTLLSSGLDAGSGYKATWIRDMNTFIQVALGVNPPQRFRDALLMFFKFQGSDGNIVDLYWPPDPAKPVKDTYRTSPLAPGLIADKNTVEIDQESSLVQAVFKYVTATKDQAILEERIADVRVRERLARALQYLMTERFDPEHGLVWSATRADWGDVQPESPKGVLLDANSHRALSIYDNAMLVIAINNYLQLPGGNPPETAHWKIIRDGLKQNIRKHLWDAKKQKFIPHVYLAGSPFPEDFDESAIFYHGGTAVAIEAELLTPQEALRSLSYMEADVRAAGAASIGLTLYPAYPEGFFKNPQLREPYTYQNGGDWCWFGGRMIQQLVRLGYVTEAYRDLRPMADRVVRTGGFHEWWTRDNQPRGSGDFRGSAGVLGQAIEMLYAWAEQNIRHSRTGPEHSPTVTPFSLS